MPHPKQLIDEIAAKLAIEYPRETGHSYVFEKLLGERMFPDIAVEREGRCVCAVEIGYTRPEKLTAYADDFHIPDVRWYDKTGRLHLQVSRGGRAVCRSQFGTVRVYTRRHINGCPFTQPDQQHCPCPKWIYSNPRAGKVTQKAANTSSFAEACSIAQKILSGFDAGQTIVPKSMEQAFRWYRQDVLRPRRGFYSSQPVQP